MSHIEKEVILMTRIALLQPLPGLVFQKGTSSYSEFASLGFAILGGILREAGHTIVCLSYPSTDDEIKDAVMEAEVIILGDFRYYAYFCNPYPLVQHVLEVLRSIEFNGDVILAGRHVKFFSKKIIETFTSRSYKIHLSPTMVVLAQQLELSPLLAHQLGSDILPNPGYAPPDLLLADTLHNSISRPLTQCTGQLIITAGCRYRCAFCEKAGTPIIRLPLSVLERQLGEFKERGVEYIIMWDEVFGQDLLGRDAVLKMLQSFQLKFGCNTRIDHITEPFVDQLAISGCKSILFGVEIASMEEKERITLGVDRRKNPDVSRFHQVVDILSSRGIDAIASIVIGLPGDTTDTIVARIHHCSSLGFKHLYIRPLVPFPESNLYHAELNAGRISEYENWKATEWDIYPHGYPILCKVDRKVLCQLTRRPI